MILHVFIINHERNFIIKLNLLRVYSCFFDDNFQELVIERLTRQSINLKLVYLRAL